MSYKDLIIYDIGKSQPNKDDLVFEKILETQDFEDIDSTGRFVTDPKLNGNYSYKLDKAKTYGPNISFNLNNTNVKEGDWLRVSVFGYRKAKSKALFHMSQLVATLGSGKNLNYFAVRIENKLGNPSNKIWGGQHGMWDEVYFWMPVKSLKDPLLKVFVSNTAPYIIYIDKMKVEHWKNK